MAQRAKMTEVTVGEQARGNAEEGGELDGTERGVGVGGDVPEGVGKV
jgi:hypothetical protein